MKKIFIAVIITLLFIPLGCIFTLKQKSSLYGVEEKHSFPQISFENIFNSTYQNQFEKWYQQNFFLRNSLVKIKNQLYSWANFNAFYSGYNNTIIRGTNDYLYEKGYLSVRIPNQKLNENQIQLLKNIVQECTHHAINIYFIIAPDKVSSYPEYLSPLYTFFYRGITNYAEQIEKTFKEHHIPVYNAQKLMYQLKENNELPSFNKTGTHWNLYGAGKAVQESFNYFNIANIALTNIESSKEAFFTEKDISKLLNLAIHYRSNEKYYNPEFSTATPLVTPAVIIGNSFSNEYKHILVTSHLLNEETLQHYENKPLTDDDAKNIWKSKHIFFIYTVSAYLNPHDQLYKKIQMMLDNKPN